MSERDWAETAPLGDVIWAAILRGVEGYPDENTERAAFVCAQLAEIGAIQGDPRAVDGITCGELRRIAANKLGSI